MFSGMLMFLKARGFCAKYSQNICTKFNQIWLAPKKAEKEDFKK
jgi:hypothetical protein